MEPDIRSQIAQLRSLSRQDLLSMWQSLYHRAAPEGLRRELIVLCLAYKIQETACGGLKPSTRSELRRIARHLAKDASGIKATIHSKIKSGTTIVRQWRGQIYEVLVTESGYEFKGASFKSLSQIARTITGTRWSGPLFFGLKKGNSDRALQMTNEQIRCAIYTRKSSEEGLEQSFNSLEAQREACIAYINSQKHEGWVLVNDHYDDGGYLRWLDGTPRTQASYSVTSRLARVQTVVVYKVDRLTRSLADFAKIIEVFDSHERQLYFRLPSTLIPPHRWAASP